MQGSTALHQAAMHGHARVVQSLLEYGADPNPRTADVSAPLLQLSLMLLGSCMTCYASQAHPLFRPMHALDSASQYHLSCSLFPARSCVCGNKRTLISDSKGGAESMAAVKRAAKVITDTTPKL